jgi:hypothetical protein
MQATGVVAPPWRASSGCLPATRLQCSSAVVRRGAPVGWRRDRRDCERVATRCDTGAPGRTSSPPGRVTGVPLCWVTEPVQTILDAWCVRWRSELAPVNGAALSGIATAGIAMAWIHLAGSQWVPLVDDANLAFHEAGHLIYGLLGGTAGLYGGTLGQLTFPLIAAVIFFRRRQTASLAVAGIWLCENWLNIARYMADARAQALPLVGGGEHDWTTILLRWNALQADVRLATLVRFAAVAGLAACVALAVWRWRHGDADT